MATHYQYDGAQHEELPFDLSNVPVEPVYTKYPGWKQSLENVKDYEDMPANVKSFISTLEKSLKVPVSMVSIGPERKELVIKENASVALG